MKTLEEYLNQSTHYLFEKSCKELDADKKRILAYYHEQDLEENFLKQIESNPEWVKLAETTEVKFYIEEPLKQNRGCARNARITPGIFLRIFDSHKTPVIKVVI